MSGGDDFGAAGRGVERFGQYLLCGCRGGLVARRSLGGPHAARLATFLLRGERYFPGPGGRWMLKHRHWLSQQQFDDAARAPAPRRV